MVQRAKLKKKNLRLLEIEGAAHNFFKARFACFASSMEMNLKMEIKIEVNIIISIISIISIIIVNRYDGIKSVLWRVVFWRSNYLIISFSLPVCCVFESIV